MKKFALLFALQYASLFVQSQQDSLKDLEEAVVYSNKFLEKKKNLAQKIDVISAKKIATFNSQNTGDLLINTGNVFVQKSQQGGSSPVIRGFEASRVLLVVDGIRMNNAIYRGGHLQNAITVDQNMLERVEVLYGPSSTIYGSDALGGVVHFRTKSPAPSQNDQLKSKGTGFIRYSSANNEKTGHADLSLGWKKIGWLQSYTFSDFGDMKMGNRYKKKYPDFGRRSQYIKTIDGVDYLTTNDDDRIQRFSGYKQWDIMQKLLFRQNDKVSHHVNLQYSSSSDVPRYDRLQDVKNFGGTTGTVLRFAEWYYGPQTRFLASYELNVSNDGFFNELRVNVNYQYIKESRQQREYLRYDRFDSRRENVKVAAFNFDGRKVWGNNEITVGIDGQLNDVKSVADRTNLSTGIVTKLDSRYPNGKNSMNYFGIYTQHLLKSKNEKWVLNDGIRLQTVQLHSTIADNSFFNLPVTDTRQNLFAVTGNLGVVYKPTDNFRMTSNFSAGFRAPNIDDMSKIFESSTVFRRVIVPNTNIKPERTYNIDLGFSQIIKNKTVIEITGFYTWFKDAIASAPFKLNGQDSIVYDGVTSAVFANQNVNQAYLRGLNARISFIFSKNLNWENTINQTFGRYKKKDGSKIPLDHVPPVFGKTSLTYTKEKLSLEFYGLFNGWKRIKDYNPDGEDNGQYATPNGMPSWFTLNWRGSYKFTKNLVLQAGIENTTDRNYRYFASGFSAPGRNYILAFRADF